MLTSERKSDFSLFSQTKQQYAKRILLRSVSFSKDDPAFSGNKLRPLTPLCLPWRDDMPNWYIPSEKIGQFLWPPKNVFIAIHLQHWTSGNELWQFSLPPLGSRGGPKLPKKAKNGPKWPKMTWTYGKWLLKPSPLKFCPSRGRFEWSHD